MMFAPSSTLVTILVTEPEHMSAPKKSPHGDSPPMGAS
jgi:hypothetical protein